MRLISHVTFVVVLLLLVPYYFYVSNMAAYSSSLLNKHSTFHFIQSREPATTPPSLLAKAAVECARLCVGELPRCHGFQVDPDALKNCQVQATPTSAPGDPPDASSGLTPETLFYDRVPQCPHWEGFVEVKVNQTTFCLAINHAVVANFTTASDLCQAKGGYLLRLDSLDEFDAILAVKDALGLSLLRFWIGATDMEVEGQWVHEADGLPIDPEVFQLAELEPTNNSYVEDCASLHGRDREDLKINLRRCKQERGFICEAEPQ